MVGSRISGPGWRQSQVDTTPWKCWRSSIDACNNSRKDPGGIWKGRDSIHRGEWRRRRNKIA